MITPEPMSRVRIITPQCYSYEMIEALYQLKLLHVFDSKEDGLDIGAPLKHVENLSECLLLIRNLKSALGFTEQIKHSPETLLPSEAIKLKTTLQSIHDQVNDIQHTIQYDEEELKQLEHKAAVYKILKAWGIEPALLAKVKQVSYFIGTLKNPEGIAQKIGEITKRFECKQSIVQGEPFIFLLTKKDNAAKVQQKLEDAGFAPTIINSQLTLEMLEDQIKVTHKSLVHAKQKWYDLKNQYKNFILEQEFRVEEEIKKAELPLQFVTTKKSLIASGFIPKKQLKKVEDALLYATRGSVFVEEQHIEHDEAVPVKLRNNKVVKNFEVLTRLYELPNYLEFDPSILFALTFPIFFGIMLGDMGYGLVTLLLFLFLRKKFSGSGRQLCNVLIYASIVTILFGAVFGEFFGFEHVGEATGEKLCDMGICLHKEIILQHGEKEVLYVFPHLISRMESKVNLGSFQFLSVLFFPIIFGALHLNFGLLLGFFNVLRAHGLKLAILEKLSWITMEAGLVLLILSLINMITLPYLVGAGIFALSVIMIYLGEGVKGIIEIPALLSNMLSYMRLGAVGLASVGLAVVINENLAEPFLHQGGFGIVIAILIMIFGHLINIGLGVLGPFLHGIRLHYVEFFSKFFHGGGVEYKPFGTRGE
ncbi:V-type ATP synthase subunit I [Candidatus Woesearchaeota archaeon]|nr:V-type ATP synthase subunit I [Candidatus Woesearchaeota archaeon]